MSVLPNPIMDMKPKLRYTTASEQIIVVGRRDFLPVLPELGRRLSYHAGQSRCLDASQRPSSTA